MARPVKLELGSGYAPTPGFVHLDANPNAPGVDIIGSAFPLSMIEDESVSEIRAVDVLEHLSYRDTDAALAEWARVLCPGGRLFVQVPDADLLMRWYVAAEWGGSDPEADARANDCAQRLLRGVPPGVPRGLLGAVTWRLLGGHDDGERVLHGDDWRLNAHYALFSGDSLNRAIVAAGLVPESCTVNAHPNLQLWAHK